MRGGDQGRNGGDGPRAARSRVPVSGGSRHVYVVRTPEHRRGGVGTGLLAVDPALLEAIAKRAGTPVYVYSANLIRAQYHALDDALRGISHRICYSVKAKDRKSVV